MGQRRKLKAYIRDDRPAKLKSFLTSHDVDPCDIYFSEGRNLLHYCAECGSSDMMRCLLRLECDPAHRDKNGRLPLHAALYRCLDEDGSKAKETYQEMACLLLSASPSGQDVEDRRGHTAHDLMTRVKKKLKAYDNGTRSDQVGVGSSMEDEMDWRRKLATESHLEWEEQESRYGWQEEYAGKEEQAPDEDFSSWSDRMYQEYCQKRRGHTNHGGGGGTKTPRKRRGFRLDEDGKNDDEKKKKKSKPEASADPEEELRKAREEMRKNYKGPSWEENTGPSQLLGRKTRYEKHFNDFCRCPPASGKVTFGAVPWPCANIDKMVDILFCDLPDKTSPAFRKFLRKEQVRWHPDKFSQKFRDILHPDHVDKIMGKVKVISQTLNSLMAT